MKRGHSILIALVLAIACGNHAVAEDGFVAIFNGKDLTGWKINEHESSWRIEKGAIVCKGVRSHLYYVGDKEPFTNFELRLKVLTKPKANSGVYFHADYQPEGWPTSGFEVQVNNTHSNLHRTGSLYHIAHVAEAPAKDDEWFTLAIRVEGTKVTTRCNDKVIVEWTEPAGGFKSKEVSRKLDKGTFALQSHDPGSEVYFKDIEVKRLP